MRRLGLITGALAAVAALAGPASLAGAEARGQTMPGAPGAAAAQPGGSVQWRPEGRTAVGRPLVYRGNVNGVEVAWLDPKLLRPVFVPGTGDPGGPWSWGGGIPGEVRPRLVAAFNGGFQVKDTAGGWYHDGRVLKALVPGEASFVIYKDGRATVGQWGRDVDLTPDVVSVRQNLPLLVDDAKPVASAGNPGAWGASVAGIATARSGVGVDANGGLVVAMARVTPAGLADALIAAGAVRAMQMDINPDWVSFVLYEANPDGSVSGSRVMGTGGPGGLFLAPYSRDFFAVLLKPAVVAGATGAVGAPPMKASARVK